MDEGWRGSNRKIEMMGFAALYPSYGLRPMGYRLGTMGFATLYPSYKIAVGHREVCRCTGVRSVKETVRIVEGNTEP